MIEHQHQQKITRQTEAERKSQLAAQGARYIATGDGTVTDTSTKLIWQQRDDGVQRNWQDAINYCNTLNLGGSNNWRLPTIVKLKTLIDESRRPTIDAVFVNVKSTYYWSASPHTGTKNNAWSVNFNLGSVVSNHVNVMRDVYYVRCVR